MSVFNCNIKFKKVVGDSYTSTTNKLISQGFIDKFNNIKDIGKFWTANTELSNEASAILGFDVRLYTTPMRPTGRVAVPSIKYFKMIDQTIRDRQNKIVPEIQINEEANEFIVDGEVLPTLEDAQNKTEKEMIKEIYDKIGQKEGSLISKANAEIPKAMLKFINKDSKNKTLELRETKLEGQYLIVNNYKSNYLFQPVEEIKEEKKVYTSKEDSNSNFSVPCIIN